MDINFLLGIGFFLAFCFGVIAHRSEFCTMGAIADIFNMNDWSKLRMWFLAISSAIFGTQLLSQMNLIQLNQSIYLSSHQIYWLSHIVGGLCFGIGMTLASGCGNKTLLRLGAGNLKSVVVLVSIGISAYATLKGIFAPIRTEILQSVSFKSDDFLKLNSQFGYLFAIVLFLFCLKDTAFRSQFNKWFSSILIGLMIPTGFYLTGYLGYLENPNTLELEAILTNSRSLESFSFIAPIAYNLELIMLWTDQSLRITFGVLSVFGVLLGAFVSSRLNQTFYIEYFSRPDDLIRHIIGGILMGFGGICALGCTIGQGLSGISTLSIGSFISVFAIMLGAWISLKIQYARLMNE